MSWNPEDVLRVYCIENSDPKYVVIELTNLQAIPIPYVFYQMIAGPLGLPDIVC